MWIVSFKIFIIMKRSVLRLIYAKYAFSIFEKGNKQKNCARYFEICKYAFLISEKRISKKLC